ncbi:hypothetical protein PM082_012491 [Marasmius tenuissimus]|nr:hypothetical protein PM082_012491 [Marasmius tenuissimus]
MDPRKHLPPVDLEFTAHCLRRFPRARNAVDALRRLGNPPSITPADISQPSPGIQTAIQVIGALSQSRETSVIRASWASFIGPWVRALLEDIVLTLHEAPSTVEGIAARDRILMCVPGCIQSAVERDHRNIGVLKHTTPYIRFLLGQVWLKVVDECHRTWSMWCPLLMTLSPESDGGDNTQDSVGPARINVYHLDERTGLILAHHINFHIPKVRKMSNDELLAMNTFMALLAGYEVQGPMNPLGLPAVVIHLIPPLIELASKMMFKRRIDPNGDPNNIPAHIHPLVTIPLRNLHTVLRDPLSAVIELDSGILKILIEAYPCFFFSV